MNVAVGGVQQTAGTQAGQHFDFMALHRELAENCLQQSKEMLNKKDAAKFDRKPMTPKPSSSHVMVDMPRSALRNKNGVMYV